MQLTLGPCSGNKHRSPSQEEGISTGVVDVGTPLPLLRPSNTGRGDVTFFAPSLGGYVRFSVVIAPLVAGLERLPPLPPQPRPPGEDHGFSGKTFPRSMMPSAW